jgi:hypothetical protein
MTALTSNRKQIEMHEAEINTLKNQISRLEGRISVLLELEEAVLTSPITFTGYKPKPKEVMLQNKDVRGDTTGVKRKKRKYTRRWPCNQNQFAKIVK